MDKIRLLPPEFLNKTTILLPASKSISNRALIISALTNAKFNIENLSTADDTVLLQQALDTNSNDIFLKNAGTAMRFLTAFFAASGNGKEVILRGEERMYKRPISPLVEVLRKLGAEIYYLDNEGFPPLKIRSKKLNGGRISITANISSQFVTALLLIAPKLENGLKISLEGEIVSQPYISMTLAIMKHFGVDSEINGNTIYIPQQEYIAKEYFVESDWSAASYIFAFAVLFPGTRIKLPYLFRESTQGDSAQKELFAAFGLEINFENSVCSITSSNKRPVFFTHDFIHMPDLIPTFVVLCCTLKVPFRITGSKTLKYKESDRDIALQAELKKIGFELTVEENSISCNHFPEIFNLENITLQTYNDHRMAMSFSMISVMNSNIKIENPGVVEKSYPGYWKDLEKLGFKLN